MRLLPLLLALGLLLPACRGSMQIGPPTDDDDSAGDDDDGADDDDIQPDDDDVQPDDDDVQPDDDDIGPTEKTGFFIWDVTSNEDGTPGATYAYMILPRDSLISCNQWLQNYGYDVDYDYIAAYAVKGPTATWEGPYAELYSPFCDYEDSGVRCFTAWGYNGSWQDGVGSGNNDELVIEDWGDYASGSIELGNETYTFRAENCGKFDFVDDEGDETDPDPDGARAQAAERTEQPTRRGGWKLRFK